MSFEQEAIYVVDTRVLSFISIATITSALASASALFVVQIAAEGARLRREALSSSARRLRLIATKLEVFVQPLEEGHYNTFLSHVWGTGQGAPHLNHAWTRAHMTPELTSHICHLPCADQMRIVKQKLLEMAPE